MTETPFNPQMLILARMSRGVRQTALAHRVEVSQGLVSKAENGLIEVGRGFVAKCAKALDYPESFFYQRGEITPLPWWFHEHFSRPGVSDE
jgi:transcriptional regulator with XRE-family HTH domain